MFARFYFFKMVLQSQVLWAVQCPVASSYWPVGGTSYFRL